MIELRPIRDEDGPAVFAALDQSRSELARWMSWYRADYRLSDAIAWVQRCVSQQRDGSDFHFAIWDAGQLAGVVSLEDVGSPGPRAMLGYWIATPVTGRGIATAAVNRVLAWAAAHTNLRLVWALVAPINVASRRVLEANGFQRAAAGSYSPIEGQVMYERQVMPEPAA